MLLTVEAKPHNCFLFFSPTNTNHHTHPLPYAAPTQAYTVTLTAAYEGSSGSHSESVTLLATGSPLSVNLSGTVVAVLGLFFYFSGIVTSGLCVRRC